MSIKEHPPQVHIPVLLEKTLELLSPQQGDQYLDLTAGYGGHAQKIFEYTHEYRTSVLVDRDNHTVPYLQPLLDNGARFIQSDFLAAAQLLVKEGKTFNIILADLGVSSPQLDRADRGFSFSRQGPLDMRMDQSLEYTAADVVNTYSEQKLADIIRRYGEEKQSDAKKIASMIVSQRPFYDTKTFADAIASTIRRPKQRIHSATRTFQALRIEVNDELRQVEELLPLLPQLLVSGGRVGVISFHSLEDRLVKRYFSEQTASGFESELKISTKKPIDGATYDVHNPRSRSAKLRVAVKI